MNFKERNVSKWMFVGYLQIAVLNVFCYTVIVHFVILSTCGDYVIIKAPTVSVADLNCLIVAENGILRTRL